MSAHDRIPPGELGDPDPTGAEAALRRAGERARRVAAAAGQAASTFRNSGTRTAARREGGRSRLRLERA